MRVLCIKSHNNFLVSVGEWYEVEEERKDGYMIHIDAANHTFNFYKHLFVTEKELRKLKLDKINDSRRNLHRIEP